MSAAERETGDAILKAAAELIGEHGYKGTTTRAIAERAGVNEVTLFRRFGSKQGVLRALGELWARSMAGFAVDAIPDPADTRGTLEALARIEVRQALEMGAAALRLALDARSVPEVAEVLGGGPQRNLEGLADYLTARQGAGDLRVEPEVVTGHAAAALLEMAGPADVIVVGSRGRGGFRGLLMGSTSTQCAQHATCPVVVVPDS